MLFFQRFSPSAGWTFLLLLSFVRLDGAISFSSSSALANANPLSSSLRPLPRPKGDLKVRDFWWQASAPLFFDPKYRHTIPQEGLLHEHCVGEQQYFKADGTLGKKGLLLRRELANESGARSTPMKHLFFRNKFPNLNQVCPRFSSFTDDQKLNFWIWYLASIAEVESDCGRNAYNPDSPDGVSAGELQMPEAWKLRSWRGLNPYGPEGGGCNATGSAIVPPSYNYKNPPELLLAEPNNNLSCAVEVLAGVLCGFYANDGISCLEETQELSGHGFWYQMQNLDSDAIQYVRSFPLCGF